MFRRLLLCLMAVLLLASMLEAQSTVSNPPGFVFSPPANYSATYFDGSPQVGTLLVVIFTQGADTTNGVPVKTADLGKPAVAADGKIHATALKDGTLVSGGLGLAKNVAYVYVIDTVEAGGAVKTRSAPAAVPFGFETRPATPGAASGLTYGS